jgi:hypothetical protein
LSGYIKAKAKRLLDSGVGAYRIADFYKHPPSDLNTDEEKALLSASQQLVDGYGYEEGKPIRDIAVNHFVVLAHCFHFVVRIKQSVLIDEIWRDTLNLRHVRDPIEVTIFLSSAEHSDRQKRLRREPIFQRIGPNYRPVLRYSPKITVSEVVGEINWEAYRFVLHTNCTANGTIQYRHVLFCYALDMTEPCLAVTAELSTNDPQKLLLCAFYSARHRNFGSLKQIETVEQFKQEAILVAKTMLSKG